MFRRPSAEQLEAQSVLVIECTIPPDWTIAEWRRSLAAKRTADRSPARLARRLYRRAARPA
jgi:hypothetical protein